MPVAENVNALEKRQNKIEEAIDKLTDISNDLSKMLAVQEMKINQQEKDANIIYNMLEKRREELDHRLKDVNEEIYKLRTEASMQHKELSTKMSQLEKFNWMTIGGAVALSWVMSYLAKVLKLI